MEDEWQVRTPGENHPQTHQVQPQATHLLIDDTSHGHPPTLLQLQELQVSFIFLLFIGTYD